MADRDVSRMMLVLAWSCMLGLATVAHAQGLALTGVGPVNRSMGGAATAAPLDAAGALHWNPASISGLPSSEVAFGLELLLVDAELSSSFPTPLGTLSGSDGGEPGVAPIPMVALVHKPCHSRWTYGLGMYGVAGFRSNYPASPNLENPILSPQAADGGLGLGAVFAEAEILQIAPAVSYALTERLSVGVAPTINLARVAADPLVLAPPDAEGRYLSGRGTRWAWGAGIQAGVYYIGPAGWHWGLSVKSPQWFEDFRFKTQDGQVAKVDIDYPLIVSLGGAYSGWQRWLLAYDVRFFDYANTPGLGNEGYGASGELRGLGWQSIMSVHTGVQYKVSECLYLRAGYVFQQNPVNDSESFFNVASPLIVEHVGSVGASYALARNVILSVAYIHGFQNEVEGPYVLPDPVGPVPGSSVSSRVAAYALSVGFTVRY